MGAWVRIMAVDVGIANMGVVVFEVSAGQRCLVHAALIQTEQDPRKKRVRQADDDIRRISSCYRQLCDSITTHQVTRAAVELPTMGAQSAAALKYLVAGASVVACAVIQHGLMTDWYSAGEVRQILLGKWTSSKQPVLDLMEQRYPCLLTQFPRKAEREHVLDALAVFEAALIDGNVCRE